MENANSVSTPVAVGLKLSKNDDSELIDPILFQSLVGNLMYLTATRLDIAYEVSLISRFMECPRNFKIYSRNTLRRNLLSKSMQSYTCWILR